jgi:putative membrane protein
MRKNISLVIKGFIIGIANIIPGVSGGTLAITLGIYEKLIETIGHFFSNLKENLKFLIPIGVGAGLSIVVLSNIIKYSLKYYKLPTTLFFVGLIVGGLPLLVKKIKEDKNYKKDYSNYVVLFITFVLVAMFAFMKDSGAKVVLEHMMFIDYLKLFLVGVVAAGTMVIPGISGSFVLMLLGYYEPIINVISDVTHFNNIINNGLIILPFGLGIIIGIVVIARIIEYLLSKQPIKTYYGIIGFVCASLIAILMPLFSLTFNIANILIGLVLMFVGIIIAYKLGDD